LKFAGIHSLVMDGFGLLLMCVNVYLSFPSSLLRLILGKAKLDGVLAPIDFHFVERSMQMSIETTTSIP